MIVLLRRLAEPGSVLFVAQEGCTVEREGRVIQRPEVRTAHEAMERGFLDNRYGGFVISHNGRAELKQLMATEVRRRKNRNK